MGTQDTTIKAVWIPNAILTINLNGGIGTNQSGTSATYVGEGKDFGGRGGTLSDGGACGADGSNCAGSLGTGGTGNTGGTGDSGGGGGYYGGGGGGGYFYYAPGGGGSGYANTSLLSSIEGTTGA